VLQSQLKAIGVPVEIQQLDSSAVMKATTEGAFDLLLWRYDWNDPDALNIYLSTSRIRQTNRVFYSNPTVDALFEKGLREVDPTKRGQVYEEAQKLILADAPWQPLYYPMEGMVSRNRVQGLKVGSLGRMLVNDVTLSGN
jgi:peptide/nickel transport system substrate-binding protein